MIAVVVVIVVCLPNTDYRIPNTEYRLPPNLTEHHLKNPVHCLF